MPSQMVPPSSKHEALARYSVSREVPRSVLKMEEQQKVQTNESLEKLIESFRTTVELYRRLMFEILGGGTEGWNSLCEPVDKTCYPEIVNVLEELKVSEERNVELAKCVADGV